MLPPNHRYESLDALRSIACLMVIWQHVSESLRHHVSGGLWTSDVADYFDFGRIGVVAFFCLSGFVIPSSLRGPRLHALRSFAFNRFFRLYPIYWIALAVGILTFYSPASATFTAIPLAANASMLATFFGQPHVMGLVWTLELELVFYAATALLYLAFGQRRFEAACCGFLLSFAVWKSNLLWDLDDNLPLYGFLLCIMFACSTLRCIYEREPASESTNKRQSWRPRIENATLALMAFLVIRPLLSAVEKSFLYEDPVWNRYGWGHLLGIVLFAAFCLISKAPSWLSRLGRSTYSVYLFHAIVFTCLGRAWTAIGLPPTRLELLIAISAIASFGIAYSLFKYIEKPCIRIGRRLGERH